MAYFLSGGDQWYVLGDPNPYAYEDEAAAADQQFNDDPEDYVAGADPDYPPPDPAQRGPVGRIGGERKVCECSKSRWTESACAGVVIGAAIMIASLIHWRYGQVELITIAFLYLGWGIFQRFWPIDPDFWLDQNGEVYYAPRHAGEAPRGPLRHRR
jgi:hypothetical protein